jgi:hypothetical protein
MTLLFPDADTLRLVVGTDGLVPAEVLLAPATVSADAAGRVAVETDAKLPKKPLAELAALGVTGTRRHLGDPRPVTCWPQILPVEKLPKLPELSSAAPVLFELPAADLPALAGEMLRLSNDRQQILALAGDTGDRVLLRVVGPPYYTLLRALDDPAGEVRAFAEAAPRVWVRLGWQHPFAALLKPAAGQMLLIGPPAAWEPVPDGPFRDIYEVLKLELPANRVDWQAVENHEKLNVPLTLAPGSAADAAELWVLRGAEADKALDQFVREADARLVQRLKFAVADAADGPVTVLRTTASRLAAPVLALPGAVGFRPFSKLPNLYLPAGRRLHPTLRRDAVRSLLADDPDQLVWLYPVGERGFTPESLPEAAFRPLADWVEYVVSENAAPLSEWVAASTFAFEPFVCADTDRPKPAKPADDAPKARKPAKPAAKPVATAEPPAEQAMTAAEPVVLTPAADPAATPTAEWRARREELETRFLHVDGPLDHPDRLALWPDLAVANAGAGEPGEAAVCWLNAAWAADRPAAAVSRWLGTEFPAGPPADAAGFDRLVAEPDPTPGEARRTAALILAESLRDPVPAWLPARLPAAQRFLAANEGKLPVRAVWLAAARLADLGGADTLGLARVRDRLLARMLDEGLNPERDLPGFLRFAGLADSDRVRLVRAGASGLHAEVRGWCEAGLSGRKELLPGDQTATLGYVDLLFAFGLARLGDTTAAAQLTASARQVFATLAPPAATAAGWLADAYGYRVDQVAAGKSHAGGLPPGLLARLDGLRAKAVSNGQNMTDDQLVPYSIDRLRFVSRVLEPVEKLDPYRGQKQHAGKLHEALVGLEHLAEPAVLARRVRELYDGGADGRPTPATRANVLAAALPLAHRAGEAFALELAARVDELTAASPPADQDGCDTYGFLLERGLFLAGFYDRREVVQRLAERFVRLAAGRPEPQRFSLVRTVGVQALRSLHRLGLRDEVDKLVGRLPGLVFTGTGGLAQYAGKPLLGAVAPAALAVAAGWQVVGLADRAAPILAEAEGVLTGPAADKLSPKDYPEVVRAYLAAVGLGPAETGLERMRRLFTAMREPRLAGLVKNTRTSARLFSVFHLAVAEEAVLAATGDEFALGPAGKRWLEEDEQLVRRRLHRDMKRQLERGL